MNIKFGRHAIIYRYLFIVMISAFLIAGCKPIEIGELAGNPDESPPVAKSGELSADESWSGNIKVEKDIIVPKGVSLTIDKGTKVKFARGTKLIVDGSLYVEGDINKPIFLTSGETERKPGDWGGIIISESCLDARLQYCIIDFHTQLLCQSDSVRITDSVIAEASVVGLICDTGSPAIEDNMITKNQIGIRCEKSAAPTIDHNAITANLTDGIECKTSAFPKITFNVISNNRKDGISCYSGSAPEISNNNIMYNGGWAVYGGGKLVSNFIQGNKERGMEAIDTGESLSGDQYYGVESVGSPRSSRLSDAGVRRKERR